MNATDIDNSTIVGNGSMGGSVPHYIGLKFGEDGVREPPSFTEYNNVIIMVVGLSLLIVPVMGFLVCMCAKSRVLKNLKGMKFTSGASEGGVGDSGLPYSQFDSEAEDLEATDKPKMVQKGKPELKNADVRVLISNDNTFVGSPNRNGSSTQDTFLKGKPSYVHNSNRGTLNDDYATLDVDATFVVHDANINNQDLNLDLASHSYT